MAARSFLTAILVTLTFGFAPLARAALDAKKQARDAAAP